MTGRPVRWRELNAGDQRLIGAARDAARNAYAPYSGFAVGAAVRSRSGRIHPGANLENASYGLGLCAETVALGCANAAGDFDVEAVAVVGFKFTAPRNATALVTPCGRCRQLIFEAGQVSGVDVEVLSCSGDLSTIRTSRISELLPAAFGPDTLDQQVRHRAMRQQIAAALDDSAPTPLTAAG